MIGTGIVKDKLDTLQKKRILIAMRHSIILILTYKTQKTLLNVLMISRILVLIAKEKSTPRSKIKGGALILGEFFLNVFFLFIRLNSALITLEDAKFLYNVRSFFEMCGETSPLFIPRLNQFAWRNINFVHSTPESVLYNLQIIKGKP